MGHLVSQILLNPSQSQVKTEWVEANLNLAVLKNSSANFLDQQHVKIRGHAGKLELGEKILPSVAVPTRRGIPRPESGVDFLLVIWQGETPVLEFVHLKKAGADRRRFRPVVDSNVFLLIDEYLLSSMHKASSRIALGCNFDEHLKRSNQL
eukprot:GABV01001140.1.p1 GENE.GABV01001140.1~~GABV01001140.1.p1  ORF type:complete len:151 (-),score=26.98 GABV01001140.1:319-771(-)